MFRVLTGFSCVVNAIPIVTRETALMQSQTGEFNDNTLSKKLQQ